VLELDGLTRCFGDILALDHLTFSVPPGQVFGFLGPNGAGKTTAMRAIFGVTALDEGEIRWKGVRVGAEDRRRFGYMPEERGLYPGMKVGDQLVYFGRLHGLEATAARRAAEHWLERLGVVDRFRDKVEALSLGNQQRVQLAAAMVHEPELLVLDEPFSGLDPTGVDSLGSVLADEAAAGRSVIFSSHQLDLVENLCQSVAIVHRGRLVAAGTVDALARSGEPRLVVKVEGDAGGAWAKGLPGVQVAENVGGRLRLILNNQADSQAVLAAAMAAGRVEHFAFERRRLSEVFREATSEGGEK
jgi:ABC-2 type transport system ATP-binding protein